MLQPGTLFDSRYELVRKIGRGGFAEVWLVKDTLTGLEEALKIYAPGSGMDEDGLKIFAKELSVVHDLRHTNLLTPQSLGQYENQPYLILPYCPNGSLNKLVGLCPEDEAWRILEQVAAGLAYLHEQGIVHQDVKPDNILIDAKQYYVITDFGISLRAQSTLRKSMRDQANSGTRAYMAPERFSTEPRPIPANDIWSLGTMMFELIEGDVPFVEQMGGLAQKGGADIPTMHANVSDNLKRVIQSLLALNPEDRPTAAQLVELAKSRSAPSVSAQPEVVPAFTAEDKKTQIIDKNTLPKQDESQHEQEPKTKDAAPQQTPPQIEAPAIGKELWISRVFAVLRNHFREILVAVLVTSALNASVLFILYWQGIIKFPNREADKPKEPQITISNTDTTTVDVKNLNDSNDNSSAYDELERTLSEQREKWNYETAYNVATKYSGEKGEKTESLHQNNPDAYTLLKQLGWLHKTRGPVNKRDWSGLRTYLNGPDGKQFADAEKLNFLNELVSPSNKNARDLFEEEITHDVNFPKKNYSQVKTLWEKCKEEASETGASISAGAGSREEPDPYRHTPRGRDGSALDD